MSRHNFSQNCLSSKGLQTMGGGYHECDGSSNVRRYSRRGRRLPFSSPPTPAQPSFYTPPLAQITPPALTQITPPPAPTQTSHPTPPADDELTEEELVWVVDYAMAIRDLDRLRLSAPTPRMQESTQIPQNQGTATPYEQATPAGHHHHHHWLLPSNLGF